jgi:type I restriction enzyme S subunit
MAISTHVNLPATPRPPTNETLRANVWQTCDILRRFAVYEMQSWRAKSYFLGVAKKMTKLATINRTKLGEFPMLLPPVPEQRRIVAQLDAAKAEIAQMLKARTTDRAMIDQVEQSILAQAFRGELR